MRTGSRSKVYTELARPYNISLYPEEREKIIYIAKIKGKKASRIIAEMIETEYKKIKTMEA